MENSHPNFWKYFWAYLLICSGNVLIALNITDRLFMGKKESLAGGLIIIWLGVFYLIMLNKNKPAAK